MKTLLIALIALFLSGCVTATYTADPATGESFKMTSFLKSVDGLSTEKGNGKFKLKMDKTNAQNPTSDILEILRMMQSAQQPGANNVQ